MEVRDAAPGMCGQYRLSWHHDAGVCEETTHEYWGDTIQSKTFCVVSREAIRKCKQELCKQTGSAEYRRDRLHDGQAVSSGSGAEEKSNRHVFLIAALVFFSLICCCICLRR